MLKSKSFISLSLVVNNDGDPTALSSAALLLERIVRARGGFVDEDAHLRMGWLVVRVDADPRQLFGSAGAYGEHHRLPHLFQQIILRAHLLRHLDEMHDLHRGQEDDDVDGAGDKRADCIAQRFEVLGQGPLIDRNGCTYDAAVRKRGEKLRIGGAYSWRATRMPRSAGPNAPSSAVSSSCQVQGSGAVTVMGTPSWRNAAFGLGPRLAIFTWRNASTNARAIVLRLDDLRKAANAYAGEKDHEVKLACEEASCELQRFLVRCEREFPHGGRYGRFATGRADELCDLRCATALERQHPHSVKAVCRHASLCRTRPGMGGSTMQCARNGAARPITPQVGANSLYAFMTSSGGSFYSSSSSTPGSEMPRFVMQYGRISTSCTAL